MRFARKPQPSQARFDFKPGDLSAIPGQPLIYWWDRQFLGRYASVAKLGDVAPARKGLCTGDDGRFNRHWWEAGSTPVFGITSAEQSCAVQAWAPTIKGAKGTAWIEPLRELVRWSQNGLENRVLTTVSNGVVFRNPGYYFRPGVAFSMIGSSFTARAHRYRSVFGNKGSSVFPDDIAGTVCLMNSSIAKHVLESLNPGIGFEVGDVNRLPMFPIESADAIYAKLEEAFTQHEQAPSGCASTAPTCGRSSSLTTTTSSVTRSVPSTSRSRRRRRASWPGSPSIGGPTRRSTSC